MNRRKLALVALGGLALACIAAGMAVAGGGDPVYWVDGAVPSPTRNDSLDGCVQYSADRPDVTICSPDVPRTYIPPPAPYYDATICSASLAFLRETEPNDADRADPATCLVTETLNGPTWDVSFDPIKDFGARVHVPFDPSGEIPFAAHP